MTLNNRGESLLTVMIAIALTAIVASAALSMYSNLMKQQKTILVRGSMQNLVDELRLALSTGDTCKLNLQNQIFSDSSPTLSIQNFRFLNIGGASLSTKTIVSTSTSLDGFNVTSISLGERQVTSLTTALAKLKLVMSGSGLIGVSTITRSFPILITTDTNGLITNCRTFGGNGTDSIPQNSGECAAKYGPGWYYQSGTCLPPNNIPASTADCTSRYGAGWTYSNGACVPPAGASCSSIVNKSGYTQLPAAAHGQVVNGTNYLSGITCPTNCSCAYLYQCFNGSFQFISWYTSSCAEAPN